MDRDRARIWLAGVRILNGAAGLVAPTWLARRVRPEPVPNAAAERHEFHPRSFSGAR